MINMRLGSMIRGVLAEFGLETPRGLHHALTLCERLVEGEAAAVPALAQRVVAGLVCQIEALQTQLVAVEKEILA